jgi:hypothetical protein
MDVMHGNVGGAVISFARFRFSDPKKREEPHIREPHITDGSLPLPLLAYSGTPTLKQIEKAGPPDATRTLFFFFFFFFF